MTIDELYRFVQYVANKEQRGFIKPSEFDLLAKRSQLDLIKDRVGKPSSAIKEEGYKSNSLRDGFDDALNIAKQIIGELDGPSKKTRTRIPVVTS